MENIRFRMKRSAFFTVKPEIYIFSQFMFDQIQCGWLRDSQIISSKNTDLCSSFHCLIQIFQQHFHTRFHQKGHNNINTIRPFHTVDQLIIEIHSFIPISSHHIRIVFFKICTYSFRRIKFSHFCSPLSGLASPVIQ